MRDKDSIGPGSRKLIRVLDSARGDYFERIPTPNGWGLSVIRVAPTGREPRGGSDGAADGLFEVALLRHGRICTDGPLLQQPRGSVSPTEAALILHDVFDLPEAPNE